MINQTGWKYFRLGSCSICRCDRVRLYVPVLEGHMVEVQGKKVLRGPHVDFFDPVCDVCRDQFDLKKLCTKHRIPLRNGEWCRLCPK